MTYGRVLPHLLADWENGEDVPELRDRPQIPLDLEPVLMAWTVLSRCKRSPLDPVPVSEVLAYLDAVCIMEPETRGDYVEIVTLLDADYRAALLERNADPD